MFGIMVNGERLLMVESRVFLFGRHVARLQNCQFDNLVLSAIERL